MSAGDPIYLDYAASTPLAPEVAQAMAAALQPGRAANPGSPHRYGAEAAAALERARAQVAALIGAESRAIHFTGSATEANNLALIGGARACRRPGEPPGHLIASSIDHSSIREPLAALAREGWAVTLLTPDGEGRILPAALRAALRADTALVALTHVNNELGVLQPLQALGSICRERGIRVHLDAAQAAARCPIEVRELPVDSLSLSAHKLYGPSGIGALWLRRRPRARVLPLTYGGGQEGGVRPGTPAVHQAIGFGTAARLARARLQTDAAAADALHALLRRELRRVGGLRWNGRDGPAVPGIVSLTVAGVDGEALVAALAPRLALSRGAACAASSGEPSPVLRALGHDDAAAAATLRLSFGRYSTPAQLRQAAALLRRAITRLRAAAPEPIPAVAESIEGATRAGAASPVSPEAGPCGAPRRLPVEVGSWPPGPGVATGSGGAGQVRVQLQLRWVHDRLVATRYRVLGPPALARLAAHALGTLGPAASVDSGALGWAEALRLPAETRGLALVVEDALHAALAELEAHARRHGNAGKRDAAPLS